ncbi:MFS transporter [Halorubrum sp. DTA98]|uniref:MFS transporter n=1 Tax=Halorubrum sp. DTA98 TaxID=3402163 RepID=UPI003AABDE8D
MPAHAILHLYELSIPLFMVVWLTEFDVTAATLGGIVTAGYAMWGLGAIPGGKLADRYGSKRLIAGCLVGMGASFLLLSLSFDILVMAIALVCWGTAASVYHPAGLTVISKGIDQQGSAFAYHGMAGNVGIGLGPLIVAVLLVFFEWRLVAALLTVPTFFVFVLTVFTEFDETTAVTDDDRSESNLTFRDGSILLFTSAFAVIFGIVVIYGLYLRGALTFLPGVLADFRLFERVVVGGREIEPSQFVYTWILLVGVVGQYAGGKLIDRLDRTEIGLGGALLALSALSVLFVFVADRGIAFLLVLSVFFGFVLFMIQPFEHAIIAEHTSIETRGLSYGYMSLGVFGVGAVGATVTGVVLTYFSMSVLFVLLSGTALVGSGLTAFLYFQY